LKKALWLFALLALLATAATAQIRTSPLFIVERSKNTNVVHYDAQFADDGNLDPKEPVVAYWILLAEDGRRKKLSWIERKKAYGFTIESDQPVNSYKMIMVAIPEHHITVKQEKDAVRAEVGIDGRPAVLEKMYINATDGLLGPKVRYIEVHGKDLQTGEKRYKKLLPK
jgi:hypothetical protein